MSVFSCYSNGDEWEFHFHEVIVIATVVYAYTWSLPIILWLFLIWRDTSDRYSLIKIQSIYGYSMAIFIPLTVSGLALLMIMFNLHYFYFIVNFVLYRL